MPVQSMVPHGSTEGDTHIHNWSMHSTCSNTHPHNVPRTLCHALPWGTNPLCISHVLIEPTEAHPSSGVRERGPAASAVCPPARPSLLLVFPRSTGHFLPAKPSVGGGMEVEGEAGWSLAWQWQSPSTSRPQSQSLALSPLPSRRPAKAGWVVGGCQGLGLRGSPSWLPAASHLPELGFLFLPASQPAGRGEG